MIRVFDIPGLGDIELPVLQIIADIDEKIGKTKIDGALIVFKL